MKLRITRLSIVLIAILLFCNCYVAGRPFVTRWRGEAGQEIKIPIVGKNFRLVIRKASNDSILKIEPSLSIPSPSEAYIYTPIEDSELRVEAGSNGVEYIRMSDLWNDYGSLTKLLFVEQFGSVSWTTMQFAFHACPYLQFAKGIDVPDLRKVTDMSFMFADCDTFNAPLNDWDVSHVTDMSRMFAECSSFNQPLAKWDVSKVNDMSGMFANCESFNQPLGSWDVSQVTQTSGMFFDCALFNQPLDQWNVEKVTNMCGMFFKCTSFNQSLGAWKINPLAYTEGMQGMFVASPAAELPFVAKWREAGCQLDDVDEDMDPEEEYITEE